MRIKGWAHPAPGSWKRIAPFRITVAKRKVCAWEFIIRQVLGNPTFTGAGPSNTENINSIFEQAQSNMLVHGQHFH